MQVHLTFRKTLLQAIWGFKANVLKGFKKLLWQCKIAVLHMWGMISYSYRQSPQFLIIGTQKGGTSSLFYYLKFHPQIKRPIKKEIHYFNQFYHKGIKWYLAHFPKKSKDSCTGEASPDYLFHPSVPKRVFELNPDMKLIVLLRDPVLRAYSAYQMNKRLRVDKTDTFEQAVSYEIAQLKKDKEVYSQERHNFFYLERGKYTQQLSNWLNFYNKKQFLLINSENLLTDTNAVLKNVYDFLEIKHTFPKSPKAQNVGQYPPLAPELQAKLKSYFEEDLKQLKKIWGIELSL